MSPERPEIALGSSLRSGTVVAVMRHLARRLIVAVGLTLVVSLVVFFMMRLLPGDPALIALGDSATATEIAAYRDRLGLNDPLLVQYGRWIINILTRWDFGQSVLNEQDVSAIIRQRLPTTLVIALPSLLFGVLLGVPLGIVTAIRRGTLIDTLLTLLLTVFLATPRFLIAIFGVLILALKLHLIPLQGYTAPWVDFAAYVRKAAWPVFVTGTYIMALVARHMRASLLDVLHQDYIRTARANGLSEWRVIVGHALRNGLIPVVTVIGLEMPHIVGGAVVVETIFNIPGIGQMILKGVTGRDYLVVQAAVLVMSVVTIGAGVLVDLAYTVLDPRIRRAFG